MDQDLFVNRMALCLLVYGVFIAYYTWRSFKPAHWVLRDHDGYQPYPSTSELPDWLFPHVRRYKEMIRERMRLERDGETTS